MTFPNMQAAEYQARRAQEELEAARHEQAIIDTFREVAPLYSVMARVPDFGQFVAYSEDGILAAVFEDKMEADRFAAEVKPPVGRAFVVEPVRRFA